MADTKRLEYLKNRIDKELDGLIDKHHALFDLPFHTNIGDGLIWDGECFYLKSIDSQCDYCCSYYTCNFPYLDKNVTILFHGGGNLGDLYHEHIEFLFAVIEHYPNHKVVVFPQTIYYKSTEQLISDMEKLCAHDNLTLCARDQRSYDLVYPFLKERVRLVPDMAFCIPLGIVKSNKSTNEKLFMMRRDDELNENVYKNLSSSFTTGDVKDWPTFYHKIFDGTFIFKSLAKLVHQHLYGFPYLLNRYCQHFFHQNLRKIGVDFLQNYSEIYTTRLHGCILALLMGKQVHLFDNIYGKNSSFYETWLKDFEQVEYHPV